MTITTVVYTEYIDSLAALPLLIGELGTDFGFYECDKDWWAFRLYSRIN